MPCYVDLHPVYNYFDLDDRVNYLFFNTPLVPLTCEAMKILEKSNLLNQCSEELRLWFEEHKKCDENEYYKKNFKDKTEKLKTFIEFEKKITNKEDYNK